VSASKSSVTTTRFKASNFVFTNSLARLTL
jgi:hypothetical protein